MAIVKGPLLSLDARGQIGQALVYLGWKGLKTVRQYVIPANPQTADQVTQRGLLTDTVAAWKNYFTGPTARVAWDRSALLDARPMSGFNIFTSNAMLLAATDADGSMCNIVVPVAAQLITFTCLNMDDGAQADEAGDFEIWAGTTPTGLTLNESVALAAGDVVGTNDLGDEGDTHYVKLRKAGVDRSGVAKITLLAA